LYFYNEKKKPPHPKKSQGMELLGRTIRKKFYVQGDSGEKRYYRGKIVSFKKALTLRGKPTDITTFRVRYQDGDNEDLVLGEINKLLLCAEQAEQASHNEKEEMYTRLAERAHCWYFTLANTLAGLLCVQRALKEVRYVAYYDDAQGSHIKGFVYNSGVVSKNKMLGVLEDACWEPICGQLHHDKVYSEMKSRGLLVEIGHPPIKRPTQSEYNAALETLDGPWWM
jgi:hypothetical protein